MVVFFSMLAFATIILVSGDILLIRAVSRLPQDPSPAATARIFNVRLYYVTAALLVLASVTVIFAVPINTVIGNLRGWDVLVG